MLRLVQRLGLHIQMLARGAYMQAQFCGDVEQCPSLNLPLAAGATRGDAAKRAAAKEDASRRAAEECLCLLAVLRALLSSLGAFEQEVMQQMASDLKVLINKQRYLQVCGQGRAHEWGC
jgi:hypothetical protein